MLRGEKLSVQPFLRYKLSIASLITWDSSKGLGVRKIFILVQKADSSS